jgi:hypothetical protein
MRPERSTSDMIRWLTPQEVGNMAGGFTAQFIRMEIKAGLIPAKLVISKRGRLGRYRIKITDAQAYVSKLHSTGF